MEAALKTQTYNHKLYRFIFPSKVRFLSLNGALCERGYLYANEIRIRSMLPKLGSGFWVSGPGNYSRGCSPRYNRFYRVGGLSNCSSSLRERLSLSAPGQRLSSESESSTAIRGYWISCSAVPSAPDGIAAIRSLSICGVVRNPGGDS